MEVINAPKGGVTFVGDSPGYHEEKVGSPFAGVEARILLDAMAEAGLTQHDVNFLYVAPTRPPGNNFAAHPRQRLMTDVSRLRGRLRSLKPSVVIPLGPYVAHAVIPDWLAGSPWRRRGP